jgi:hypothetical protein
MPMLFPEADDAIALIVETLGRALGHKVGL